MLWRTARSAVSPTPVYEDAGGGLDTAVATRNPQPVAVPGEAEQCDAGRAERPRRDRTDAVVKRVLDICIGCSVLVLASPLMLLVAAAIVLESPGPVFYYAERVGRQGRPMRMMKFRKMRRDAGGMRLTMGEDVRLTRVGKVLTRTKLDELPQFVNVLKGEMSLVGPRPEDPAFVVQRQQDYDEILRVRPGVTGLAQLAFAQESHILDPDDPVKHYLERIFPAKCGLDRLYVARVGTGLDLRILWWSVVAVCFRRPVAVDRATGAMRLRRRP